MFSRTANLHSVTSTFLDLKAAEISSRLYEEDIYPRVQAIWNSKPVHPLAAGKMSNSGESSGLVLDDSIALQTG